MTEERKITIEDTPAEDEPEVKESPGTGEPMVGIEVPADGTQVTITNEEDES